MNISRNICNQWHVFSLFAKFSRELISFENIHLTSDVTVDHIMFVEWVLDVQTRVRFSVTLYNHGKPLFQLFISLIRVFTPKTLTSNIFPTFVWRHWSTGHFQLNTIRPKIEFSNRCNWLQISHEMYVRFHSGKKDCVYSGCVLLGRTVSKSAV